MVASNEKAAQYSLDTKQGDVVYDVCLAEEAAILASDGSDGISLVVRVLRS